MRKMWLAFKRFVCGTMFRHQLAGGTALMPPDAGFFDEPVISYCDCCEKVV